MDGYPDIRSAPVLHGAPPAPLGRRESICVQAHMMNECVRTSRMERGYPCIACTMVRGLCCSTPSRGGASGGGARGGLPFTLDQLPRGLPPRRYGPQASDRPEPWCDVGDCAISIANAARTRLYRSERGADRSGNAHFVEACLGAGSSTSRRRDYGISPMATNAATPVRDKRTRRVMARRPRLRNGRTGPSGDCAGDGWRRRKLLIQSSSTPFAQAEAVAGTGGDYALRSGPAMPRAEATGGPIKKGAGIQDTDTRCLCWSESEARTTSLSVELS